MTRAERKIIENWVILYYDKVLALSLRLTGNRDDAQDCAQEVFIRAWKKYGTYRGEAHPMAWLKRITLNICYNHLNRNKSKRWDELEAENLEGDSGNVANMNGIDPALLKRLSPLERSVVIARIYEDLSFRMLAESLGTTENNAKVSYHNAIVKLRKLVK
ncbi:MAG: RNA polymerase sigma factor [Candidatus Neomarinimicrobiota bacterium]|nr:RNA polymerase sigma factor [Candidatus Neomarinimicrobiota bacterium]MDD3966015.1 RNA polymerase sigma factor [Candidatus Neomarinimicrobiota bacterium]MDX9780193.1 RNA polymerase sigma factor [bacterium]